MEKVVHRDTIARVAYARQLSLLVLLAETFALSSVSVLVCNLVKNIVAESSCVKTLVI
jgi:hypothetical protein